MFFTDLNQLHPNGLKCNLTRVGLFQATVWFVSEVGEGDMAGNKPLTFRNVYHPRLISVEVAY